ncbi:hypothetical protein Q6348_08055 [Isoptericola sp. b441]|uniref:Uncharacterized protein n=1 Tax=Actinotalea lenta TaxID=3064654 RepID=A0ABT9D8D4_9CELL|nr:hypothetical protein [Isoptericola sp. b441]MDO8107148.1 hypothetical protein [Isoptericola sp. b441]
MAHNNAINARVVEITEYGTDPRGWGLFAAVTAAAGRTRAAARRVLDPIERFSGYAVAPQGFTGAANLGSARPVSKETSTLPDERAAGVLSTPAETIFAQRLGRKAG